MILETIKKALQLFLMGYCIPIAGGILAFTCIYLYAQLLAQNSL